MGYRSLRGICLFLCRRRQLTFSSGPFTFLRHGVLPFLPGVPIDPEVLAWFEAQGEEYQARINAVLRAYIEMKRKAAKQESA